MYTLILILILWYILCPQDDPDPVDFDAEAKKPAVKYEFSACCQKLFDVTFFSLSTLSKLIPMQVETEVLFEIMKAANYLDIRGLMDSSCKVVANLIMGKSPEQIREVLNIPDDLTAKEKEQIKRENE